VSDGQSSAGPDASAGPARSTLAPMAAALAVMVVWGGTPLLTKLAVAEMDPLAVGVLRTVLAGVLAWPLALAMRCALPVDRRGRVLLAVSGLAAFVVFPLVFSFGQQRTSALHAALILATLPVFTSLFGHLVERRRFSRSWIAGCALALGGEAAVILWRPLGATGSSPTGDAIVLASAVVCSVGYVAGARLSQRGYPSLSTTLWGVALSSVVLVPALVWTVVSHGWPTAGAAAWASIAVLAFLTSIIGYVVWYWALARGGISRVASVQFTQPLFGLALAALVLGERPAAVTAVAGVLILAGAFIVQRAVSREPDAV